VKIIETELNGERITLAIPEDKEVIGVVEQALPAGYFRVRCFDGVTRLAKIKTKPGRMFWVKEGDYVLVLPWEYSKSKPKGWILYAYNSKQVEALKKLGYLKDEFEDEF